MHHRRHTSPAISEGIADIAEILIDASSSASEDESSYEPPHEGRSKSHTDAKLQQDEEFRSQLQGLNSLSDGENDEEFINAQLAAANRKTSNKSKSSKKSGGFQSLGLNPTLLKAISRKGFSVPTPIQRKVLPLILDGRDVVGMARTGSGKTAAFVIPIVEKLKAHRVQVGTRAIILSPSRELAIQSLKTVKELSKGTDLRTLLIVGGDSLEDQFNQITSNPDIIIATPGRFLHLIFEMSLDLSSVSHMVFDEADRLFEMGFKTQLTEILHALPASRQTMLFSATLPKSLVEFARAGLKDPQLVRLDAETKISPDLQNAFLTLKSEDKDGALLYILGDVIKMPQKSAPTVPDVKQSREFKKRKRNPSASGSADLPTDQSTIVFAASQKQVEYLSSLLTSAGYAISFVYGNLDQAARRVQIENFRRGITTVLVVTDVAARGIDIPLLANVINYDFPAQPKMFIHRVGRTARAGRSGWSYNLLESNDLPYLLDLQLFLGRKLVQGRNGLRPRSLTEDIVIGGFPRQSVEPTCEQVTRLLDENLDLKMQRTVAIRAKKHYSRTRTSASAESAHRSKLLSTAKELQEAHPIFESKAGEIVNGERDDLLSRISGFRPSENVFEIGRHGHENEATEALRRQKKRMDKNQQVGGWSGEAKKEIDNGDGEMLQEESANPNPNPADTRDSSPLIFHEDDAYTLTGDRQDPDSTQIWQDADIYMSYHPRESNLVEETGYGVNSGSRQAGFINAARGAAMDLDKDEISRNYGEPSRMRWDKRGKKYVSQANDEDGSRGKRAIVGESGQKIAASFRSGRFEAWKKANRIDRLARPGEKEAPSWTRFGSTDRQNSFKHSTTRAPKQPDKYRDDYQKRKRKLAEQNATNNGQVHTRTAKSELRSVDDVRKQRLLKQKRRDKNARPSRRKKK